MNELFNTIFGDAFDNAMQGYSYGTAIPNVDVTQTADSYIVEMDLPGRTENDINIELDHNVLTVASVNEEKADKEEKKEVEKETKKWLLKERRTQGFKRSFTMPDDIDAENVTANFKNGVLNVVIPRKAAAAPKRIAITA